VVDIDIDIGMEIMYWM